MSTFAHRRVTCGISREPVFVYELARMPCTTWDPRGRARKAWHGILRVRSDDGGPKEADGGRNKGQREVILSWKRLGGDPLRPWRAESTTPDPSSSPLVMDLNPVTL